MSEHDNHRPLTRRELRLRAMAAAGQRDPAPVASARTAAASGAATEPVISAEDAAPAAGLEIPLVDEHGRLRSRRELRRLRELAEAERAKAAELAEAEQRHRQQLAEAEAQRVAAERVAAEQAKAAELAEAEQRHRQQLAEAEAQRAAAERVAAERAKAAEAERLAAERAKAAELAEAEQRHRQQLAEAEAQRAAAEQARFQPKSAARQYSFPDISPLDEQQPIFTHDETDLLGVTRELPASLVGKEEDFDALIHRAVAQEGAASTTNTAALILSAMPESETLSGPLGDTGEFLITGSIKLPQSLSETGEHDALYDPAAADRLDEFAASSPAPAAKALRPVAARKAVSARTAQSTLVTDTVKDKSRLPAVLITTGGLLMVVAAGLIIWVATSGMFG